MSLVKPENKLLLSRLLTRSGDQAWDFVVPFALLHVFPGRLQIAAVYYLIIKIGTFTLAPSIGRWIDSTSREFVVRLGVWIQFFAVLGGMLVFWFLDKYVHEGAGHFMNQETLVVFAVLCAMGIFASVGSLITDISVGNDMAPTLVAPERLTTFNSLLRRVDLGTEVGAPVLAGILFSIESSSIHLFGLILIALWNLISFVPEYFLLKGVLQKMDLKKKTLSKSTKGWRDVFKIHFIHSFRSPIFLLILSYAMLWLSVLSPHGVLLAGYLKDQVALPEAEIGIFRGAGALFGLISTITFPYFVKKWGLIESSKAHILFQVLTLTAGILALQLEASYSIYIFLAAVLLSRVGLYGFSNGEFELRQRLIPEDRRGELNSLSYFMTTFATLILFGAGSLLPSTEDFKYLVYASLAAVLIANVLFFVWSSKNKVEI